MTSVSLMGNSVLIIADLNDFCYYYGNLNWLNGHDTIINALKSGNYNGMSASLVCAALGPNEVEIGIQSLSTSMPYALFITPFDIHGSILSRNVILISEITKIRIFNQPFKAVQHWLT